MPYSSVLGHTEIVGNLRSMVESSRMPHALLFTEKAGYGALPLVLGTLAHMFGNSPKVSRLVHPDIHFIFPINTSTLVGGDKRGEVEQFYPLWRELVMKNPYFSEADLYKAFGIENKSGTISVAEASSIIRKMSLSSYEGGAKVMLIMFPERMTLECANKLLKNLEEPESGTYYFLISHNPEKIISTIISRCRIIEVPPIGKEIVEQELKRRASLSDEDASFWAKCSGGSIGKALELIGREEEQSDNYNVFVSILEGALQKDLCALTDIWEQIASYGKERQKELCTEGEEILRKLYMLSLGLDNLSYAPANERNQLEALQKRINVEFYRKGYGYLNDALECIERNVNPKFIFCDLCNRIYCNI